MNIMHKYIAISFLNITNNNYMFVIDIALLKNKIFYIVDSVLLFKENKN